MEALALSIMDTVEEVIGEELVVKVDVDGENFKGSHRVSRIDQAGDEIGPARTFDLVYMNDRDFKENDRVRSPIKCSLHYLRIRRLYGRNQKRGKGGSLADIMIGVTGVSLVDWEIMVLTVLYISIVVRSQEVDVIKTVGGRKKDIRRIFVSVSFLIGLFSVLAGLFSANKAAAFNPVGALRRD